MTRQIPLLFDYRDRVEGAGFSAIVTSHGCILAEEGDGEVWIYGVEPGALAADGTDPRAALEAFRHRFTNVLRDFAADAHSFAEFETAVSDFFHAINVPNEQDWLRAVEAVRSGQLNSPKMRRERADSIRFVQVQEETTVDDQRDFSIEGSTIQSAVAA